MDRRCPNKQVYPVISYGYLGRQVGRRALLRALADEYEFGNSVSKLYVSLLARTMVEQEPRLLKKPDDPRRIKSDAQANLERCGVRVPATVR